MKLTHSSRPQRLSTTKTLTKQLSLSLILFVGAISVFFRRCQNEGHEHQSVKLSSCRFSSQLYPPVDAEVQKTVDPFYPMHITECTDTMPGYYAPCFARKLKHTIAAEELIYPAFEMTAPIFAPSRPLDAQKWWNTTSLLWERAYKLGNRLRYNEKHGQIFVSLTTVSFVVKAHDRQLRSSKM